MTIYVVTHKIVDLLFPNNYKLMGVGNDKHINADIYDDSKDNISYKNSSFCELTALYWLWKNSNDKQLGLCHYRRLFMDDQKDNIDIVTSDKIENYLSRVDIILPSIYHHPNMSVYEHYINSHQKCDIDKTLEIIKEKYPSYLESFYHVMNGCNEYGFNMFISSKKLIDDYATWLFDILFELEKKIDISSYDDYQKRVFGFLGERLFNVWIYHNKLRIKELPIKNTTFSDEKILNKKIEKLTRKNIIL